jgi:general secretion pathway protein D
MKKSMNNGYRQGKLDPPVSQGLRLTATAVLVALSLSGCDYLGPVTRKQPVPTVLLPQEPRKEPVASETVPEERPAAEKEYYPPTGALYGRGAGERPETVATKAAREGKYTLNFDDADLGEVSKVILGDTLKVNYVLSPKVAGKVSLQTARPLTEDELIPTLEMLLRMNGAVLIKNGPLYKIEPEAAGTVSAPGARLGLVGQDLPPGYQLRVVPLRYVGVQEMQKVVEPLMPPKSVLRADEARNLLLLAGSSDELESVIETIRIFDVDFMRGMAVGLYPLKNVDAATISDELTKLLGDGAKGPLGGMFRIMPIDRLNAIMAVSPQPRYLDEVESWIERLDRYTTAKTGNMHVYRVQNVDAVELANTLGQIFGQGGRGRTPGASLAPGLTGATIGGAGGTGGFGASGADDGGGFGGGSTGFGGGMGGGTSGISGTGIGTGGARSGLSSGTTGTTGATATGGLGGGTGVGAGTGATGQRQARRGAVAAELGNNNRVVADPANNALIIFAKAQDYKEIEAIIKELDVMPLQVLIDATIVEVSLIGELRYGLQWLFTHGQGAGALAGSDRLLAQVANAALAASGPGGFAYAFAGKDIKVIINALASDNKVNVISSPSLMVLNNQEANIVVGDKVATPTGGGGLTPGGIVQGAGIQYQESGVMLKVRPRVNVGGLVIMDISQEISTPTESPRIVVPGVPALDFRQRKIQSQAAVNDGETLALGGLIEDRDVRAETGIPWLNKIPVLGWLFGARTKAIQRTELVVLLTPRVVAKRQDITTVTNEFRRRLTGLRREYGYTQ